jgi:hypothetical protein
VAAKYLLMDPHPNVTFGGGSAGSTMSPIGLAAMLVATVLVLVLPRRWVIVPWLFFAFLVPTDQQITIAGFHFFAQRIVILFGCLRFLFKPSSTQSPLVGGFTRIDKMFLIWALCRATAFVLLYREGGAVANQVGFLWDALGGYFLVRCLIRGADDIRRIAKTFAVIAFIMAGCMLYEHYKVQNVFALLMGGRIVPNIRNGSIRCRGVFEQEIIASTFGGTLVPLFLWLWIGAKERAVALVGLISSVVITITASSSTGISAAGIGMVTLCLWPVRQHVRWILWGLVAAILGLNLVMKAPVWFLLARVDFVGGSTGWDRANLIDQCVRHFSSWWLVGTADNDKWGFYTWDLCNQFVAEAVQGGLATLILFVALITRCFRKIGLERKKAPPAEAWLLWTIGCILCAHLAGFFGISYFDQMKYWWYVTLAMVPAACIAIRQSKAKRPQPVSTSDPINESQFEQHAAAGERTL